MKAILPFFLAALTGSILLLPGQTKGSEVSPRAHLQPNQVTVKNARLIVSSTNSKARVQTPATAQSIPPGVHQSGDVSPAFQVSSDPLDQVWLSVGNGIVTIHGSVATDDLAEKLVKQY